MCVKGSGTISIHEERFQISKAGRINLKSFFLKSLPPFRLVFTSDGDVVGVVMRSVKRYDLVKIKPTESEAEH